MYFLRCNTIAPLAIERKRCRLVCSMISIKREIWWNLRECNKHREHMYRWCDDTGKCIKFEWRYDRSCDGDTLATRQIVRSREREKERERERERRKRSRVCVREIQRDIVIDLDRERERDREKDKKKERERKWDAQIEWAKTSTTHHTWDGVEIDANQQAGGVAIGSNWSMHLAVSLDALKLLLVLKCNVYNSPSQLKIGSLQIKSDNGNP